MTNKVIFGAAATVAVLAIALSGGGQEPGALVHPEEKLGIAKISAEGTTTECGRTYLTPARMAYQNICHEWNNAAQTVKQTIDTISDKAELTEDVIAYSDLAGWEIKAAEKELGVKVASAPAPAQP